MNISLAKGKVALQNICAFVFIIVLTSCEQRRDEYIDYVQVSDQTYLGVSELASDLDVPWDMQFSEYNNSIFFTEIKGKLSELDLKTNTLKEVYQVPNVYQERTLGLLGLAIHPNFEKKPYLYICYTTKEGENIFSELAKLSYEGGKITQNKVLLKIEGASGHNGSRLTFDKNNNLYWATGDAHSLTHSQDSTTLNGKVLRMTDDGKIPSDNPIPNSYVYAWGFRNMQGMAFTPSGKLYTSEHGDAIEDEVNWIRPLHNYGWIDIEGYHDTPKEIEISSKFSRTEPIKSWTPVIAPAALVHYNSTVISEWSNSLLLGTLKDQSLRILQMDDQHEKIISEKVFLKDYYGRIRAITVDNKGNIYIATSNRDWKKQVGFPKKGDDRILKLSKIDYVPQQFLTEHKMSEVHTKDGKTLYESYCASCHMPDGKGITGSFPPLTQTNTVEDANKFLKVLLKGLSGKITVKGEEDNQVMPAFSFLSNEEISKIASYVRTNFGNNYSTVDSIDVKKLR